MKIRRIDNGPAIKIMAKSFGAKLMNVFVYLEDLFRVGIISSLFFVTNFRCHFREAALL